MDFVNDNLADFDGTSNNFTDAITTVEQSPCQVREDVSCSENARPPLSARILPLLYSESLRTLWLLVLVQQVPQSYRLQYPDGSVHELSARLGPLACSLEEWSSYGLDQNAWYAFSHDAATCVDSQALTARLVHALSSSTAVSRCWDHAASAMVFVLPNYAQRSDAARRVKKVRLSLPASS